MRIRFDEIPSQGISYAIREIPGLTAHQDFTVAGPIQANCVVLRGDDDKVALQGKLSGPLTLVCDRCLTSFHFEMQVEWQQFFVMAPEQFHDEQDQEYCLKDLDTIVLEEPVIDLDDILRQQVYLALPVKALCADSCLGICPRCGVNMNQEQCSCTIRQEHSPFAVLAQLKNRKE
ncbi:YceD family protein [Desulfobulbus alkaliphilus]|uniref:YceD family protein n=1 Tax=Desulfobulbus alkaliphilus TaxID=869814 RepID=UPI00196315E1|nr:DUF177 domain-containing protein [Desulfobulbus alkaliphilus]MBM9535758.1 DUF177 domain-containing protein [Desulfobulbus alkaliphilus]